MAKTKTPSQKRRGATFIQRSRTVRPSEKAAFHDELGAGRSRVKREFFALNQADEDAIVQRVDDGIRRMVS